MSDQTNNTHATLGIRKVYLGFYFSETNDKLFIFFASRDLFFLLALIFINTLFAIGTHRILFPEDGSTLINVLSAIGGFGYLFVFIFTSFSLFLEGNFKILIVVLVLENILTFISFVLVGGL